MVSINTVYRVLQTIINKEINGHVSPDELNVLSNVVQYEIFREYFEDENRDKIKENRGMTNKGYSNLDFNQRQRIDQFAASGSMNFDAAIGGFPLPADLYFIEDDGITTMHHKVIEEVERGHLAHMINSIAKPTEIYPVYERFGNFIKIYPSTIIEKVDIRYLRKPKAPKWTYTMVNDSEPLFNPANPSFQDFELHESEFSNIVMRMLAYFGVNLREEQVVQYAEGVKNNNNIKDNQ